MVELNKAEVHKLAWASLSQLNDAFNGKISNLKASYEYDPSLLLH